MMEYIIDEDFLDPATFASADATGNLEELVRCKNCKNWIPGGIEDNDTFTPPRCKRNAGVWASDDYCSYVDRAVKQDA